MVIAMSLLSLMLPIGGQVPEGSVAIGQFHSREFDVECRIRIGSGCNGNFVADIYANPEKLRINWNFTAATFGGI